MRTVSFVCLLLLLAVSPAIAAADPPVALTAVAQANVRADPTPELVARGKRATALVENKAGQSEGSSFCINATGLFVTNAHVVEGVAIGGKVTLVLDAGEATQRVVTATLQRSDTDADLALLRTENKSGFTTLDLGDSAGLIETEVVTAFGYPFGKDLAVAQQEFPAVTVSVGRVTALRKSAGTLELVQLDTQLNPGNSGGPVVDAAGHVIGIVQAHVPGAGISFAIPVARLSKFLARPDMALEGDPFIPYADRSVPRRFRIHLTSPLGVPPDCAVTLTLRPLGLDARTYTAKPDGNGVYSVLAPPVPPELSGQTVTLSVGDLGTGLVIHVPDRLVTLHGRKMHLSELRDVDRSSNNSATPGDTVSGLGEVTTTVAGAPVTIDLDRAQNIRVEPDPPVREVQYEISAVRGEMKLGTETGIIRLDQPSVKARRGVLIVAADCWPTSDTGYDQAPQGSTDHFVRNVAELLAGGHRGRCLVYSTHWAFGKPFRHTLVSAGYSVDATMSPARLEDYDAVFVGGNGSVNRDMLANYLRHGGNLYIAAATADIPGEADFWNSLVAPYGIVVRPGSFHEDRAVASDFAPIPLFAGVQGLLYRGPADLELLAGNWPHTRIVAHGFGMGLVALYEGVASEPERRPPAAVRSDLGPEGKWRLQSTGSGLSLVRNGERIEVGIATDAEGFIIGYQSVEHLHGDFDVQVDYRLTEWPPGNGIRAGICFDTDGSTETAHLLRVSYSGDDFKDYPRESDQMTIANPPGSGEIIYPFEATGQTGRLRLVREGTRYTGYLWDNARRAWRETPVAESGGDDVLVTLRVWSDPNRFTHKAAKLVFENFHVNRGVWR